MTSVTIITMDIIPRLFSVNDRLIENGINKKGKEGTIIYFCKTQRVSTAVGRLYQLKKVFCDTKEKIIPSHYFVIDIIVRLYFSSQIQANIVLMFR